MHQMSFVGLLAECDWEEALDVDAENVDAINHKDKQNKLLKFFLDNRSLASTVTADITNKLNGMRGMDVQGKLVKA